LQLFLNILKLFYNLKKFWNNFPLTSHYNIER
jgi:hypothetical protein